MPKTQFDHDHAARSGERATQYSRIEKQLGPNAASKTLQRRPAQRADEARATAYAKIERQQTV